MVLSPQPATEQGPQSYNHMEINSANKHATSKDDHELHRRIQSS